MKSSASVKLAESERPRLLHLPPDVAGSGAQEAIEFAERACGIILDPWQQWCVYHALAERSDGTPAAFEVGIVCPRQNGKNFILEVIQLASLYINEDETLVHSAHKFDTSVEHFNRLKFLFETTPELSDLLLPGDRSFVTSNGKEHIRLNTGQRILFKARHRGGGRGFTGDKVFLDEAYDLPARAIGNMIPTMSTRPDAQVFYTSSAPHETSTVLHAVRSRAQTDDSADRLFYAEWGTDEAEAHTLLAGENPAAIMAAIERANPAVAAGRITADYIAQEIRTFSGDPELVEEHKRERLGIATPLPSVGGGDVDFDTWQSLAQVSAIESDRSWSLTVSHDRQWASLGLAGRRADGLVHVEWMDHRGGTAWVEERCVEAWEAKKIPIRIHRDGPEGSFIDALERRKVGIVEVTTAEYARSTGWFLDLVNNRALRHLGQPSLDRAVKAARLVTTAKGASTWDDRGGDLTALKAVTVALGGVGEPGGKVAEASAVFA